MDQVRNPHGSTSYPKEDRGGQARMMRTGLRGTIEAMGAPCVVELRNLEPRPPCVIRGGEPSAHPLR
jgi:hypothetical protein